MAMKFTKSKDGHSRATVRVDFRVDSDSVAHALANEVFSTQPWPAYGWDGTMSKYSKARITEIVRGNYSVYGPPEQWPDHGDEYDEDEATEWGECIEAARDRVRFLWSLRHLEAVS